MEKNTDRQKLAENQCSVNKLELTLVLPVGCVNGQV